MAIKSILYTGRVSLFADLVKTAVRLRGQRVKFVLENMKYPSPERFFWFEPSHTSRKLLAFDTPRAW